jgi:hypothetical protein
LSGDEWSLDDWSDVVLTDVVVFNGIVDADVEKGTRISGDDASFVGSDLIVTISCDDDISIGPIFSVSGFGLDTMTRLRLK